MIIHKFQRHSQSERSWTTTIKKWNNEGLQQLTHKTWGHKERNLVEELCEFLLWLKKTDREVKKSWETAQSWLVTNRTNMLLQNLVALLDKHDAALLDLNISELQTLTTTPSLMWYQQSLCYGQDAGWRQLVGPHSDGGQQEDVGLSWWSWSADD